MGFLFSIKA